MSYRDDSVALESRCQAVEQDRDRLRGELDALAAERRGLEREVQQQRWRLRGRRLLAWAGRHKLAVAVLLAAVLIPAYCSFRDHAQHVWKERRKDELLRRLGCLGWLQVASQPAGAVVLLDGQKLGATPLRERVCPGRHLVRLVSADCYAWQRLVEMPARGELGLAAQLYRDRAASRPPGTLILSEPSNAIVFLNGLEMGRTPLFVPEAQARSLADVSVVEEGYLPVRARPRPHDTMWFALAPQRGAR